ncbi:MAG: YggS family pyridoxal phosphate-dependent enzyme [Deltaproteobacteria bacterium]|nr:YggS family pyridoxal phosphate-dependent enzyme [Deltaproteobacteria bacterium]
MSELADRWQSVRDRVHAACARVGRAPDEVTIVAVSKVHPASAVAEAWAAGARDFGENYVQEWQRKAEDPALLARSGLRWSFIGHLQRNKVRHLLGRVDLIETVDSTRLAREISRRGASRGGSFAQKILLQVNLAGEEGKGGFHPDALRSAMSELTALPGVDVRGLMHIPPARRNPSETRVDHRALRTLRDGLEAAYPVGLPVLSMGMSSDFEVAIEEGATRVRVGTAVFGARPR